MTAVRTAALLAALMLAAACRRDPPDPVAQAARDAPTFACALAGKRDFGDRCTVERQAGADGEQLLIRHPDGGFRRLRIATDGRGVVTVDGAEDATVTITGPGEIEVAVGGDRYRLPATVKSQAPLVR